MRTTRRFPAETSRFYRYEDPDETVELMACIAEANNAALADDSHP